MVLKRVRYFLLLTLLISIFATASSVAQEICGTAEIRRMKGSAVESDEDFERWLSERKHRVTARDKSTGTYVIPVVVHIIHNGEPFGTGSNIPDEQIISQIAVLNRDFTRNNADAGSTPAQFRSVAGAMDIRFELAKQDPGGLPTTGIVRVRGTRTTWRSSDESELKSLSYWPAESYLNFWITDLAANLLGYAQFPVSALPGLHIAVNNRLTDGIVVDFAATGDVADDTKGIFVQSPNYNKGRVATHEVGHFLGLRHIWGDDSGSCAGNGDYVADTPDQAGSNFGCPAHPQSSCTDVEMFQNYMDYTNGACMNIFTVMQVQRMETVLESSPRRLSLLTSDGALDPGPVENDLAITSLGNINAYECEGPGTMVASLINKGSNTVLTAELEVALNSLKTVVKVTLPEALQPGHSFNFPVGNILLRAGANSIVVTVLSTNGTADGKPKDNTKAIGSYVPFRKSVPEVQEFTGIPPDWHEKTETDKVRWQTATAHRETISNSALFLNLYNLAPGRESNFIFSPEYDFTNAQHPWLVFDLAYARANNDKVDGLEIYAFSDCGDSPVTTGKLVYSRSGASLATTSMSSGSFFPTGERQWRQEVTDLREFAGLSSVRFAIRGLSGGGNNIFIDDFTITGSVIENVSLVRLLAPSPVSCSGRMTPHLLVKNNGVNFINSLKVRSSLDGAPEVITTFSGLNLAPGEEKAVELPGVSLEGGNHSVSFVLVEPNGLFDTDPSDNTSNRNFVVDSSNDRIPLRQTFTSVDPSWTAVNPDAIASWTPEKTIYGTSLVFPATLPNAERQGDAWLVSPVLDFSSAEKASVFFDVASTLKYGGSTHHTFDDDAFRVRTSIDCGRTWSEPVFVASSGSLQTGGPNVVSPLEGNWRREFISLSHLAGQAEVRAAFTFRSMTGSRLFIDNIEFFTADNPEPPQTGEALFALYPTLPAKGQEIFLTFNLREREDIAYEVVDMSGRILLQEELPDILNQTIFLAPPAQAGVYVLRMKLNGQIHHRKFFVDSR